MITALADRAPTQTLQTTTCPDLLCGLTAEIVDRWTWGSTGGPVEMVKVRCGSGHWHTVLTADLPGGD